MRCVPGSAARVVASLSASAVWLLACADEPRRPEDREIAQKLAGIRTEASARDLFSEPSLRLVCVMDEYLSERDFAYSMERIGLPFEREKASTRAIEADEFGLFIAADSGWRSHIVRRQSVKFENYDAECFDGDSATFVRRAESIALTGRTIR